MGSRKPHSRPQQTQQCGTHTPQNMIGVNARGRWGCETQETPRGRRPPWGSRQARPGQHLPQGQQHVKPPQLPWGPETRTRAQNRRAREAGAAPMVRSARGQETGEDSRCKRELRSWWRTPRIFTLSLEALCCNAACPLQGQRARRAGSPGQGLRWAQSQDREGEPGPRGENVPGASSPPQQGLRMSGRVS